MYSEQEFAEHYQQDIDNNITQEQKEKELQALKQEVAITKAELEILNDIEALIQHRELYLDHLPADFLMDIKQALSKAENEAEKWKQAKEREIIEIRYFDTNTLLKAQRDDLLEQTARDSPEATITTI